MKEIPLFKVFMNENAGDRVSDVLHSGYIGQGSKVEQFENKLKEFFGHDYVATTNSATSACHLALHLLKQSGTLSEGDEVLATPMTCTATNWPILANNLKIKWVDVDPNTCCMDLDDLERKITPKTKVVIIVNWGGYPVDLDRLNEIKRKTYGEYGFMIEVIEDCAHAFGSEYKGKKLGNHGNMCFYSFQAIKHLTCGDGGALTFTSEKMYKQALLSRWYGIDRESNRKDFRCEADVKNWGFKFHMNDINATIGLSNMESIEDILSKYRDNAAYYNLNLAGVEDVTLMENESDRKSSSWIYTMKVKRRDKFVQHMLNAGISVSRVHERNDKHTCVSEYRTFLPSLDKLSTEMICIPVGWWVSDEDREYIVNNIKKGW